MKGHIFTEEERAILLKHKHVSRVTDHSVSFTTEFKKFAVAEIVEKGRRPQDIFITEGIPISIIGNRIPERISASWRKIVETRGADALSEDRRGRPKTQRERKKKERIDESAMSDKELIEYYKTKIAYTDQEP